jgi:dTDP-glucose 4,6-dehydratase
MDTILVTGGAGFIGSNFVRLALSRLTDHIVVVDKLTYAGSLLNLEDLIAGGRVTFIRADIADGAAMRDVVRTHRPRWIVNFAAETHVDRSIDGPREFLVTNVIGTLELLEAARAHHAACDAREREAFRFLHVSTDEVYGTLGDTGRFTEETPYAPNSPYAASKAGADHLVRAYHVTFGLPAILTNCSNNYGPYQFPEKLIPLTILNAIEGRPLPVYGDGLNVRDWLHVEDHCDAILRVLEGGRPGERYNVGASCERTNLQIVDRICATLDRLHPPAHLGLPSYAALKTFVPDRPGHDRRYAIDASRLVASLGWQPKYGFDEGLEQTVRWYLSHREWCAGVQAGRYNRERLGLAAEPAGAAAGR